MALIKCNECKKEISDKAFTCPHCGYRNSITLNKKYLYISVFIIIIITILFISISSHIDKSKNKLVGKTFIHNGYDIIYTDLSGNVLNRYDWQKAHEGDLRTEKIDVEIKYDFISSSKVVYIYTKEKNTRKYTCSYELDKNDIKINCNDSIEEFVYDEKECISNEYIEYCLSNE